MNIKTKEIYSEVYQVLNLLGNDYINKLPTSLINMIREKREINYSPQYTENIPLNEQNIKKETMSIIVLLYLNYWCKDDDEKKRLNAIFNYNENEYQKELREKYNPDDIFKKKDKKEELEAITEKALMTYDNKTWYQKAFEIVRNLFKKILKK